MIKENINKLVYIKIKNFSAANNTIEKVKQQSRYLEKYLHIIYLILDFYSKHIKNY